MRASSIPTLTTSFPPAPLPPGGKEPRGRRRLAARGSGVQVLGTHLLHEIAAGKGLRGGATIVQEQPEALAGEPSPVPARISEIEIGEVHHVGPSGDEAREKAREEGGLLDEIRIAASERAEQG